MTDLIMVSVCMISYNHGNYVRQALDSVLAQKRNFKIEILIHDDASTDNTASIIKEYEIKYPNIIKPVYQKENQFSKGKEILKKYIFSRVTGKYVAFCECDDYWSDTCKLQKQVDFLEKNKEIYSIAHRHMIIDKNSNITGYSHKNIALNRYFNKSDALELKSGLFHPSTIMFRGSIIHDGRFLKGFDDCCILGCHTYMIYYFAQLSDIYISNDCMSAWRFVREKGGDSYSSRSNDHIITYQIKLLNMYYNYKKFFKDEYNFKPVVNEMLLVTLITVLKNKEKGVSKLSALKSCFAFVPYTDFAKLPFYEIKRRISK